MRILVLLLLLPTLVRVAPVAAAEARFVLSDGSTLVGEIQSVHDGVYSVRSPALGTIAVNESKIRRIELSADTAPHRSNAAPPSRAESGPPHGAAAASPESSGPADVQSLQRRMLDDDALLGSVMGLQDDPDVQAVLADPELAAAIQSGNLEALSRSPKFRQLLDNPAIQALTKQLGR